MKTLIEFKIDDMLYKPIALTPLDRSKMIIWHQQCKGLMHTVRNRLLINLRTILIGEQTKGLKMKKIILMALWSLPCLALTPQNELQTVKIQQVVERLEQEEQEKKQKQQEEAQKLSNELVASLIEHSPELIKKYVQYLKYSASAGEVKPKTLFLHGPSGVGKTETAIALAIKVNMPYTVINGGQLGTKFQNSAKNQLKEQFDLILKSNQPHVIIIDELMRLVENYDDKKGSHEDNSTATAFWDLLDQCIRAKNILVIATANDIERCPKMVKTRFGGNRFVEFQMPDEQARKRILKVLIPKKIACSEALLDQLAKATEGMPPRDYKCIIESAEMNLACGNKGRPHFEFSDFKEEIDRCKAANKEEGTMSKIMKNAKDEFVEKPISTSSGVLSAASSLASVLMHIAVRPHGIC